MASDFIGARELFYKTDFKDPFEIAQITHRCAGIFGALTKFMPEGQKEGTFNVYQNFFNATFHFLIESRGGADKLSKNALEKIGEQFSKNSKYYIGIYEKQMDKNQLNTGSIFGYSINKELEFCKDFKNKFLDKINF